MTDTFTSLSTRIPRAALRDTATHGGPARSSIASLITAGAAVLALLLATAMPARADRKDDLAKALIAALVIGAIVKETKRSDAAPVPRPEPARSNRVPAVCAISIEGAERDVTLYPESCLRREGVSQRLPRGCANDARVFGRDDRVYSAQCLRDAGFRISGR